MSETKQSSDPDVVVDKKLTRKELLQHDIENQMSCMKRVMGTADGLEMMRLLEDTFFNQSSIVPGDPYATHAREGAREVVIFIRENSK